MRENWIDVLLKEYNEKIEIESIKKIDSGITNITLEIVTSNQECYITQKLNKIIDKNIIHNAIVISEELNNRGWTLPTYLFYMFDGDNFYRIYKKIPGNTINEIKEYQYHKLGEVLAKIHKDLSVLEIKLMPGVKEFHNTSYYISKLNLLKKDILNSKLKHIAGKIIEIFQYYPREEGIKTQIIHGDVRKSNILKLEVSKEYTLIDLDTIMCGSIYIDLGDLLRDISVSEDQCAVDFKLNNIHEVLLGYYGIYKNEIPKTDFLQNTYTFLLQITIELCARFIIDYMEDEYFLWDTIKFSSRRENNYYRTLGQWELIRIILDNKKEFEKIRL